MQTVSRAAQQARKRLPSHLPSSCPPSTSSSLAKGKQPIRGSQSALAFAPRLSHNPNVGCSYWQSLMSYRSYTNEAVGKVSATTHGTVEAEASRTEAANQEEDVFDFMEEDDIEEDYELDENAYTIDQIESESATKPPRIDLSARPKLPRSIKKLNKLLSRHVVVDVPEHEIQESFVRGSGPGGQAINKTNSSVSLIHIPTGIRVQAQPTRMREQNRKAARHILRDKLDNLRALGLYTPSAPPKHKQPVVPPVTVSEEVNPGSKAARKFNNKKTQTEIAAAYSKEELRAAKVRARKAERAKKHRRKKRKMEEEAAAAAAGEKGEVP